MKHAVKVTLGTFAAEALAGNAARTTSGARPSAESVLHAVRFYLNERANDGPGWPYPGFLHAYRPGEVLELELEIDDPLWDTLESEAERQRVSVPRLLEHAAMYYAAELDAGRVTERILDEIDGGGEG